MTYSANTSDRNSSVALRFCLGFLGTEVVALIKFFNCTSDPHCLPDDSFINHLNARCNVEYWAASLCEYTEPESTAVISLDMCLNTAQIFLPLWKIDGYCACRPH